MRMPGSRALALVAVAALVAAGCGKPPPPKVDAETERAEANKRAREGPMGAQVKALDDAKALQEDVNKKAQEAVEKVDNLK